MPTPLPAALSFDDVFFRAVCPVDAADLGAGVRLLVPNGLSFGALQWSREGRFHDWFRDAPDRHQVRGSRHATHLGVDLAFYVQAGRVHRLPAGLPVRACASGVVAAAFAAGASELAPGGLMILHGEARGSVQPFSYLGDVREEKRPGEVVRAGDVVGRTLGQKRRGVQRTVVHFGVGLSIPGHGLEFVDPSCFLLRWGIRHPVFPESTCTPDRLAAARAGSWRSPGVIDGARAGPRWQAAWRTRF